MIETAKARQAFEDYVMLGPDRSLVKLAGEYRQRSAAGRAVPTKRKATLEKWSVRHSWQDRVLARVEEDADAIRIALRERAVAFRERAMALQERMATAIEVDVSRYLKKLEDKGGVILGKDAANLERLMRLFFQLAEWSEHTGKGGPFHYGSTWPEARRVARYRDNYTCQRCGITEEELGHELSVHHIVPWRESADNSPENLICLCDTNDNGCHQHCEHHPEDCPQPRKHWLLPPGDEGATNEAEVIIDV